MKLIKILEQVLNEKLGVPDGILEAAEDIFNKWISILEKRKGKKNKVFDFRIIPLEIGDLEVKNIKIELKTIKYNNYKFYSMHVLPIKGGDFYFNVNIKTPSDWDIDGLISHLRKESSNYISFISHELKHWYDFNKQKYFRKSDILRFTNLSIIDVEDIKPIDDFLFSMYYISNVENVVRSTEFASRLKSEKVTRKNFLEFLKNDDTYFALNQAKNFSYEKLKDDLKNYIPEIDKFFKEVGMDKDFKKYNIVLQTDKEKIDEFLKNIKMVIEVYAVSYFNELKKFDMLKDFGIKKETSDNVFLKSVGKFNSVDAFYKHGEKMLNSFGDKMIRKISKLYDMVDDK